jgi:cyclic pyranopterin phosphate synthase
MKRMPTTAPLRVDPRPHRSLPLATPSAVAAASAKIPPKTVRVSLTDRCDLACVYCRPSRSDGYFDKRLSDEAWQTMVRGLVEAGVRRVRITGGEPLLHPRVVDLVAFVSSLGIEDLALTTNATRLDRLAAPLRRAGLHRITISLDSLEPERFWRMTRGGRLDGVLAGIDAALAAGYDEVKTNTVVLRDANDDELPALTEWAWARGITPRFIELMRIGEGARLPAESLVGANEMRARLSRLLRDEAGERHEGRGPAKYVRARHDPAFRAGFITGSTDTYCDTCDRLRVASDGMLRPCLATNDGVLATAPANAGDVGGVVRAIAEAWEKKPDGRVWKGCTEASAAGVSIRAIGG